MQVQSASTDAIRTPTVTHARNPRLENAAHQFEASLIQELMQPMQNRGALFSDDAGGDGSGEALTSYASEAFSKALSDHGGLGIATRILNQLGSGASLKPGIQTEDNLRKI